MYSAPPNTLTRPHILQPSVFFFFRLLEFCISENLRQSTSLSEQEICYMRDLEMFLTLQALLQSPHLSHQEPCLQFVSFVTSFVYPSLVFIGKRSSLRKSATFFRSF